MLRPGLQITTIAVGVNLLLAVIKTLVGVLGRSNALIADGIESAADVISSLIVWGGLRLSVKPADADHPFGHGKAEPIAGVCVALLLWMAAGWIALQSLADLQAPAQQPPQWYTLPVLLGVIVVKEFLYRFSARAGEGLKSTALRGDAWHHRSDAITSSAAFIGISIALICGPGFEKADDWAALFACGIIVFNGWRLGKTALDEIMDASADLATIQRVREIAQAVAGVVEIEKCRVRKSGLHLSVDIHVEVEGSLTVRHGHLIAHQVKDRLLESNLRINDVTVHIEPHGDIPVQASEQL